MVWRGQEISTVHIRVKICRKMAVKTSDKKRGKESRKNKKGEDKNGKG